MSNALAYALLLIHQRQARNLSQQQKLQQLFLAFLAGELTADQYERNLEGEAFVPWRTDAPCSAG